MKENVLFPLLMLFLFGVAIGWCGHGSYCKAITTYIPKELQ